ncbi:hypothetical protein [Jeotgalibaca sp. MA1X17-3]|nr:hypothetical protein [Jeotgalibaca sp. MA1X17-3]
MSGLEEAYYGGIVIGMITIVVIRSMAKLILEIIADVRQQKNA